MNHIPDFPEHRIGTLVMHHGEYPVGALRSLKQLAYVFCINADRLIADQMLSGL